MNKAADDIKQKELQVLTYKNYKKRIDSIEKNKSPSQNEIKIFQEISAMNEFITSLRSALDLERQTDGPIWNGILEKLETLMYMKQLIIFFKKSTEMEKMSLPIQILPH